MNMNAAIFWLCVVPLAMAQNPQPKPKADVIFLHGSIYTGIVGASSFHEVVFADAMAVREGRVEAVGAESDILKLKGPATEVVDLGRHFAMPGFNDAHLHLAEAGFQKLRVDMTGVKSLTEFHNRLQARADTAGSGEWILGGGWDETLWPVKELPSRWDLDEVAPHNPIFLQRVDGHIAVANTRAMRIAGVSVATKDPEGGKIDRDENGHPTGILREKAMEAVMAMIPLPTPEKRRKALELALADLAQWGVTSAQDNSTWEDFLILEQIEHDGRLTARISEWLTFDLPLEDLKAHRSAHPQSDNMLHTGMLKGFMDGSLGSRTAALLEPYADDPNNSGLPQYEQAKLNDLTKERMAAGFQIGFHAIGDKGVQMALDAFSAAEKDAQEKKIKAADGGGDFRLRIEHAQVTNPVQIARFRELKAIASMQPSQLLTDMQWAMARLGPKRAEHSYAWAEFLNRGVKLAFGTDYPVEPVNPFRGLYAATTRKSEDGRRDYFPDQRLSMDQAIAAYTVGSAFAEFAEKDKGTLTPGMLADFIVLDRDITAATPAKMLDAKVLRTVVGGKTVYQAASEGGK